MAMKNGLPERRSNRFTYFDEYALRFDLEENFLDDKSAGFQLNLGESVTPMLLERLSLILLLLHL